ncbi:MAG: hypothetical protein ACYC9D_00505 [Candidatus Dormibacteria bacterium]
MAYKKTVTDQLPLPTDPHYHVVMRRLKYREVEELVQLANNVDVGTASASQFTRKLLRTAIVSWNLTDETGTNMPIDDESLGDLDPDDYSFLLEAAQARAVMEKMKAGDADPLENDSGRTQTGTPSEDSPKS